eukprot:c8295_g1_i1.p1 GENE.c8295_g1_i1~~c8295_g1_i1.p1  ORF type:complete len:440 (+),score=79.54 c8295_g1_i1:51-1322(+)
MGALALLAAVLLVLLVLAVDIEAGPRGVGGRSHGRRLGADGHGIRKPHGVRSGPQPPAPRTNVPALIESQGYPCEIHTTTTEDGFVLVLHRVPTGRGKAPNGKVVYLQHGLIDSSSTWFVNLANESLGYILADEGYDVWAGNVRGNGQSWETTTNCTYLDDCFWANSWDQMAQYDMPAMVSYILATTGVETIGYVGHSQGTEIMFAHFSSSSPLASSIAVFAALAPVAHLGHVTVPFLPEIAMIPSSIEYDLLGVDAFNLDPATIQTLLPGLCEAVPSTCRDAVCVFAGCADSDLNETRFDILFAYYPSPCSVQNMVHYSQSVHTNLFQMYDYGSAAANEAHYGQATPPQYNVADFSLKVGLFSGSLDRLADPADVAWLAATLPAENIVFQRQYPMAHGDFVWGLDAASTVYVDVLSLFAEYL